MSFNDEQKVSTLFKEIGLALPEGYTLTRLGKQKDNFNRVIKMNVMSKEYRDVITKDSKLLKGKRLPWGKIYINRDLHPVLVQENNRLRHKKNNLMKLEENKNKNVKIEKGKLTIDGEVVDENLFFV